MKDRCSKSRISPSEVDDKTHPQRPEPHREDAARSPPSWGRTAPASRPCPTSSPARPDYEVLDGEVLLDGENILERWSRTSAPRRPLPGLPVPARDPGRRHHDLPEGGAQRAAQGDAAGRADDAGLHQAGQRRGDKLEIPQGHAQARAQCRLLGRREEAHGDPADGAPAAVLLHPRRDRFRPRHRRAAGSSPTASTRCARPSAPSSSSPTTSASSTTSCPTACTSWRTAASCAPAGPELALELEANGYADYSLQAAE